MLKQVMNRWKGVTFKCRSHLSLLDCDSMASPCGSPRSIPSGFLAVYVGTDRRRFLIPTRFLYLPIFTALLQKAEEEYGFKFSGGLVFPCEVEFFEKVLKLLVKDEKKYGSLEVHEFLKVISEVGFNSSSSCKEGYCSSSYHGVVPFMQKAGA